MREPSPTGSRPRPGARPACATRLPRSRPRRPGRGERRDGDQTLLVSQRHRVLEGLLEVTPVHHESGAEGGHRGVLVGAVASGDHHGHRDSVFATGVRYRLAVVAASHGYQDGRGGSDSQQAIDERQSTADLEGPVGLTFSCLTQVGTPVTSSSSGHRYAGVTGTCARTIRVASSRSSRVSTR